MSKNNLKSTRRTIILNKSPSKTLIEKSANNMSSKLEKLEKIFKSILQS